jgi:secondary thiamine-phosphate synthase enzyme
MVTNIPLKLPPFQRGFHLITQEVVEELGELPNSGILQVFICHTSAGLAINENADPSVRVDMENSLNLLAPENEQHYTHIYEGSDDMPAHIKSVLCGVSVQIPIVNGQLAFGSWQGIYLCEFRNRGGRRNLIISIIS